MAPVGLLTSLVPKWTSRILKGSSHKALLEGAVDEDTALVIDAIRAPGKAISLAPKGLPRNLKIESTVIRMPLWLLPATVNYKNPMREIPPLTEPLGFRTPSEIPVVYEFQCTEMSCIINNKQTS